MLRITLGLSAVLIFICFTFPLNQAQGLDGVCVRYCGEYSGSSSSSSTSGSSYGGGRSWIRQKTPQEESTEFYNDGIKYYNAKDWDAALKAFERARALSYDPDTETMIRRAKRMRAYTAAHDSWSKNDYQRALDFLREARTLSIKEEWIEHLDKWIYEAESYAKIQDRQEHWTKRSEAAKDRVAGVIDDLMDELESSDQFATVPSAQGSEGLSFMAPGQSAYQKPSKGGAVDLSGPDKSLPTIKPAKLKDEAILKKGLKTRPVPPPAALIPKDPLVRFTRQKPVDLILDSLEAGHGDLEKSVSLMQEQLNTVNPHDKDGQEALSYLEGLYISSVVADQAKPRDARSSIFSAKDDDSEGLLNAISGGPMAGSGKDAVPLGGVSEWKSKRTSAVLDAFKHSKGDLVKTIQYLEEQIKDNEVAYQYESALRYVQGLYAYEKAGQEASK